MRIKYFIAFVKVFLILGFAFWSVNWLCDQMSVSKTLEIVVENKIMNYQEALGDSIRNGLRDMINKGSITGAIAMFITSVLVDSQIKPFDKEG